MTENEGHGRRVAQPLPLIDKVFLGLVGLWVVAAIGAIIAGKLSNEQVVLMSAAVIGLGSAFNLWRGHV